MDPRASHLILLSVFGARLAAMKREGPAGAAFRKLLRHTIIPEWEAAQKAKAAAPAPSQLPLPTPAKALPGPAPAAPPAVDPGKAQRRKQRAAQIAELLADTSEDDLSRISASIARLQRDDGYILPMEIGILVGNFTSDQMRTIKSFLEGALVPQKGTLSRGVRLDLALRVARMLMGRGDANLLFEVTEFEKRQTMQQQ